MTESGVVGIRRRSVPFRAAVQFAGMVRSRTFDEGRIAASVAALAAHSGWQVHLRAPLKTGAVADVLFAGHIALVVRTAPRPGPALANMQAIAEGACGVVLLSSLSEHRRLPSQVGLVPLAWVPLFIDLEPQAIEV